MNFNQSVPLSEYSFQAKLLCRPIQCDSKPPEVVGHNERNRLRITRIKWELCGQLCWEEHNGPWRESAVMESWVFWMTPRRACRVLPESSTYECPLPPCQFSHRSEMPWGLCTLGVAQKARFSKVLEIFSDTATSRPSPPMESPMPPTSPRLTAVSMLLWLLCSLMLLGEHSEIVLLSGLLSWHIMDHGRAAARGKKKLCVNL